VTASATAAGSSALAQAFTESYRHGAATWGADSSVGNLGQVTDATGMTDYAYLADRVAEQKGAKNYLFQYDHAGRLTSRRPTGANTSAAEVEGYGYDVEDRLRMAKAGTVREYLDYDPTGLPLFRVTQVLTAAGVVTAATGTWYVGKSATLTAPVGTSCTGVASCTPTATPTVGVHLLMGGTRIATVRAAAGTGADPIANVLYYHRDYQGSVVGTSLRSGGVDGVVGAGYRYTPYGQLDRATNVTAASDSELGYTNGLRLLWRPGITPATPQAPGLVLLGARVYHAELKRWLQPDTVDALRYTYTGGDPVNFIDPSGRTMQDPSGTPSVAISNWDFLGSVQITLAPKDGSTTPPANNEPAPAPVVAADQTPQVTMTERKIDVRTNNSIPDDITVYPSGASPETAVRPVEGTGPTVVTSNFADKKVKGHENGHGADDVRGLEGATVYAQYDGKVVAGSDTLGPKWRAVVESFKEDGGSFGQAYNHMKPSVQEGKWVKAGDAIGTLAVGELSYFTKNSHLDLIHIPDFSALPAGWKNAKDQALRSVASAPSQNWNFFYKEANVPGWYFKSAPVDRRWRSPDYQP